MKPTLNLPLFLKGLPPNTYMVGGSVRDLLLGRRPADYDIVVDRNARAVADRMAARLGGRSVSIGHGACTIHRVATKTVCIDTAAMKNADIFSDLMARDFTINAMACSLDTGDIIDPAGGRSDLDDRVVRMVTEHAFDDDPLRLLRAHRMAAELDFAIDATTRTAITGRCQRIQEPAAERIWNELQRILAAPAAHPHITAMADTGILETLFPELRPLRTCRQNQFHEHNAWDHTFSAFNALESILSTPQTWLPDSARTFVHNLDQVRRIMLKLAILLHDVGKPDTAHTDREGVIHFHDHPSRSAQVAAEICRRLRLPHKLIDGIVHLVRHHDDPLALSLAHRWEGKLSSRAVGRFFRRNAPLGPLLLIHALADEFGKGNHRDRSEEPPAAFVISLLERYFKEIGPRMERPALVTGKDLMDHFGLRPSPLIGRLLAEMEEAWLAGDLHNRKEALELARKLLEKGNRPY